MTFDQLVFLSFTAVASKYCSKKARKAGDLSLEKIYEKTYRDALSSATEAFKLLGNFPEETQVLDNSLQKICKIADLLAEKDSNRMLDSLLEQWNNFYNNLKQFFENKVPTQAEAIENIIFKITKK